MNNIETIKQSVSMIDVLNFYGLRPNRQGFIPCPFHNEKTASFKAYPKDKGFYCFGCGESGDVIDFVMKYFNLHFNDALHKLNDDFNLGLKFKRINTYNADEMHDMLKNKEENLKNINRVKDDKREIKELYDFYCAYHRFCIYIKAKYKPKNIDDINPLYIECTGWRLRYIESISERLFEELTREE